MSSRDMNRATASTNITQTRRSWWACAIGFIVLIVTIGALSRSSLAEFEVPPINTTGAPTNVEFRGVWAFNRGMHLTGYSADQYEAFAVGVDVNTTGCSPITNCNGVLFNFNGTRWSRVSDPFRSAVSPFPLEDVFSLNAIAGRESLTTGTLAELWVAGVGGKIYKMTGYSGPIGSQYNQFSTFTYSPSSTNALYAIDVAQEEGAPFLAGGQGGLLVTNANTNHSIPTATSGITSNVTGIKFIDKDTVYLTTSTFASGTPFDHNCSGTQTSILYRKTNFSGTPDGTWTPLQTVTGNCFYGLTVTRNSNGDAIIWVSSDKGLFRYSDISSPTWIQAQNLDGSPNTKPYYSVVAIPRRSGTGVNLLTNGNFQNTTALKGWTKYGDPAATTTVGGYVQVNATTAGTSGVYQTIPLTTMEGQRFRVSGDYKVSFPGAQANSQGGVALTCAGSGVTGNDIDYVNCSVSNRREVRVKGSTHGATPGTGWNGFSMIVSREDEMLNTFGRKNVATTLTKRKMDLQIRCEATYGATVSCDNLRVETVDEPVSLVPPRNDVLVIAAGQDIAANGLAVTEKGLATPLKLDSESIPAQVRLDAELGPTTKVTNQVNAMFAIGAQHVYAVGKGYLSSPPGTTMGLALFSRTPSTLAGNIIAENGPISASCADIDDSTGAATLCQTSPEAYGISLDITSPASTTRIGRLTGRGWFGKIADNEETMNLGACLRMPSYIPSATPDEPYRLTGMCDTTTRRCKTSELGDLSAYSCTSDFDCYGRCQKDEGFLCVTDADCQVKADSFSSNFVDGTTPLNVRPAERLICGPVYSSVPSSPLACTGTGWLSFNAADFSSAGQVPPTGYGCVASKCAGTNKACTTDADCFVTTYNTLYTGCDAGYCRGDITKPCANDAACMADGNHNKSFTTNNNQGAHEFSGWARFMTMVQGQCATSGKACMTTADCGADVCINNDGGWVHLRGAAVTTTSSKLFACQNCDGTVGNKNCAFCQDSQGHSCVPSSIAAEAACYYECQNDSAHTPCSSNTTCESLPPENGATGVCAPPGFCSNSGSRCSGDTGCSGGGTCEFGAICSTLNSRCFEYGVNLDTDKGQFYGWAWSEDFGWLDFGGLSYGGKRIVQTKLGDVYATGAIGKTGDDAPSSCNATYLITSASTIAGFCSSLTPTYTGAEQSNAASIPLISAENSYQNILGRFDIKGMEKVTDDSIPANLKNKYGSTVITLTPTSNDISAPLKKAMRSRADNPSQKILGGNVYTVGSGGNYTIDTDLKFYNSDVLTVTAATGGSGAGIIIVNGNLTINKDMDYGVGGVSDLRNLASLTVVVKGDLKISNSVRNIVGAYYVTGTINTTDGTTINNQNPLTVHGLMIAQAFKFLRQFAGTLADPQPSELIIYDGRLQSNPMLGMIDFTSALPNMVE